MKSKIAIFCVFSAFLVGCQSSASSTALYQAMGTDRAAVVATTTLYQNGAISKADATIVYNGALAAESGGKLWQTALASSNTSQSLPLSQLVSQELTTLLSQLQSIEGKLALTNPAIHARLATKTYSVPPAAAAISSSDIVTLVELAVQLTPEIEQWVSTVFAAQAVTTTQVNQSFTDLNAALGALKSAIAGPSTLPSKAK